MSITCHIIFHQGRPSRPSELFDKLSYEPSHDTILFAGDLMAKSSHETSLAVIDYLTKHHRLNGRQTIFPVRGNHDHLVVQWRAWREWFEALQLPDLRSEPFSIPSSLVAAVNRSMHCLHRTLKALQGHSDEQDDAIPPVHTGRAFLHIIEHEFLSAQALSPSPPLDPEEYASVQRKRSRGTWRESWWAHIPLPGSDSGSDASKGRFGHDKKSFRLFGDHYWLARDLTSVQRAFLEGLPLVNHVPHLHLFVAHAGVLPADPRLKADDKRQPLARVPVIPKERKHRIRRANEEDLDLWNAEDIDTDRTFNSRIHASSQETLLFDDPVYPLQSRVNSSTVAALRTLQETAILTNVPQNRDPWVVLNMRSVKKSGKPTRNGEKGTPWSEIWGKMMRRCEGFGLEGEEEEENLELAPSETEEEEDDVMGTEAVKKRKGNDYELKCYPSTVVYGHAATRGLDIKRWSFGLDTGCLYGRRLTALVLSRNSDSGDPGHEEEGGEEEDEESEDEEGEEEDLWTAIQQRPTKKMKFGDASAGVKARLVGVSCPVGDTSGSDDS